jgi:ligand-binding sensor protein
MSVNFDVKKINTALEDFSHATGIHIDLRDADFSPVSHFEFERNGYCDIIQASPKGKKACAKSDFCLLTECKYCHKQQ